MNLSLMAMTQENRATAAKIAPNFDGNDTGAREVDALMTAARLEGLQEISTVGLMLSDFVALALSGEPRRPSTWEHNALCWLHKHRAQIKTMNLWTHEALLIGYPILPINPGGFDYPIPAGYFWSPTMKPYADEEFLVRAKD